MLALLSSCVKNRVILVHNPLAEQIVCLALVMFHAMAPVTFVGTVLL